MRSRILATGLTLGCQLATALPSAAATANPSLLYTQTTLFPPAPSNLASSSGQPSGITVDTSGNLYLADFPGGQVLKTQPGSTGPAEVAASGIIVTGGKALAGNLALDASGNLYLMEITDSDKNTCSVIRIPANAPASHTELFHGVPNPSALWVAPDGKTILVGGDDAYRFTSSDGNQFGPNALDDARLKAHTPFYNTQGIAQDPAGNIYLTHGTATAPDDATVVSRVTPGGTVTHLATVNTDGTVTPAAAPITPDSRFGGVATDSQGNVFVADHDHILELSPTQAGSWACAFLGAGMANAPGQLVVPSPGSVVDFDGSTVTQFSFPGSFSLGSSPVGGGGGGVIQFPGGPGGTPAGQTLTVSFSSDGGAPTVTTLTGGTPGTGLDFQVTPLKPPPSGYAAGETDTLTVTFAPTAAGARNGALVLGDASGNPLVTTYLSGIGTGGLPGLLPGQAAQVPYSADSPAMGVAVDGSGNLYLADPALSQVQKVAPDGTTTGVGSSSPGKPSVVAVDGAGNVFYASPTSGKVIRETPLRNGQWQQTLVDSGLPYPFGLAVDGAGNVFVADTTAGALYRETPTLGGYQRSTLDSALQSPSCVAVDGAGNLYVGSSSSNSIWQETPGPAGYSRTTLDSGIRAPFGLAVDIAGALLVATDNTVVREVPDPSGFIHQVLAVPGLVSAGSLAADQAGNLYVTDRSPSTNTGNSKYTVWKLDFSAEQSLVFGETQAGARSFDSPQSVTLQNLGNDDLTFLAPQASGAGSGGSFGGPGGGNLPASNPQFTGPDFQWDPASSFPLLVKDPATDTVPTFTLPSLATATMGFDFAPTVAGSLSEAAIFRVRANGKLARRQVNLAGLATLGLSPAALSADYIGVAFAQTLSGVGGTQPYSFKAASDLPKWLTLDGNGNLHGTPPAPGSFSFTVSITDSANLTGSQVCTLTVPPVVKLAVADATVTYDGLPHGLTATPSAPVTGSLALAFTGQKTGYASSHFPTQADTYAVTVTLVNDPVLSGSGQGTLTIAQASVSLTWSATTFTYDGTPHAVTASVNLPPNTTAATLPTATVSYNGGSTAPTAATGPSGLPVLATLVDPTGNFSLDPGLANNTEVINPARATITLSGNLEPTYTGKPQPLTASVVTTFSPPPAATVTYDGATTPPTGAGTYAVTATLADPDFQATPASATLTIDPAPVSLALGPLNQVYSGSPRTVTARPDPASPMPQVQVSYSGGTAPTLPGSYQVAARLADRNFVLTNPTFAGIPVVTGILTVTRTTAKVAVPSGSFTYDGQPHGLTASIEPTTGTPVTGTPGYAYTGVDVTYAGATPPAAPGRYQVDVTLDGDPVYLGSGTGTLTIRPATVRLALSGLDQGYTGGPRPVTVVATPPTPRPQAQVIYGSGAAASTTAPSQPGSYPVTVRLADPDFVPIPDVTGTLTIGRGVSLALTGLSQAYDGSPRPVTVVATPAIPMSQIKVSYGSGSAATRNPPTEPGSYPVAAELNGPGLVLLDPSVPGGHQVTGTLTIAQARATVTFDKATLAQPYTGKPRTVTASVTPIAPLILTYRGKNVDYPASLSAPTKPGDYQVIATVVSTRYVGSASGTLSVDGTVKVFLWGLDQRATGKPIAVRATTSAPVQAVKVTYGGSPTPPARPGKYTVRATVVDPVLKGSAFGTLIID